MKKDYMKMKDMNIVDPIEHMNKINKEQLSLNNHCSINADVDENADMMEKNKSSASDQVDIWKEGMQDDFNQERFEDFSLEAIYGEIVLSEVQQFILILYPTLLRFYLPIIQIELLDEMREDLIEMTTSLVVN